jgi:2-polyprenyl-3-methyl-5-hydroxy-6-metoxy-1,4-benzoquinol methylase
MDHKALELLEKIRQQFDAGPYPRIPIERSPKEAVDRLYIHNSSTAYYLRNQKVRETAGITILDAGCGSGFTSLTLAEANPGARIVGVDLSEQSVELAKKRLQYHGFDNVEFQAMPIEELSTLNEQFDYINAHEVLYLLPDPVAGLQAMKSVLAKDGIIRTNLHSSLQRASFYRAQALFKMMGFLDNAPGEMEISLVRETMKALKDNVMLKAQNWKPNYETDDETVLANHLLMGDKGSTVPELFAALRAADLEFICMVNWQQWQLMDLFKEPDDLPLFLGLALPELSVEEQLHLYELFNPIHRLLDFWCGHSEQNAAFVPVAEWTDSDWQGAKVYLHPQLKTSVIKEELLRCIEQLNPFQISQQLKLGGQTNFLDSTIAACLLPLWEEAQPMQSLVKRWQQLRPVDPIGLEATKESTALEILKATLTQLESTGYVLLEH